MGPDWGDGDYGRTAEVLAPIAGLLVERLAIAPGEHVLDLGCGTGNVALAAGARGARVTAVDPARGLLDQAAERAAAAGVDVTFHQADAGGLPLSDDSFDVALSSFAVIFAPDPGRAVAELVRVTRPGGRIGMTSWVPQGAVHDASVVLFDALPTMVEGERPKWGDPDWVRALFVEQGSESVRIARFTHRFSAESPAAWFADQEEHHPFWRWVRREVSTERWDRIRTDSVAALSAANEGGADFDAPGDYLLITADV